MNNKLRKNESGSVLIVILVLLAVLAVIASQNAVALGLLKKELKLIESRNNRRFENSQKMEK